MVCNNKIIGFTCTQNYEINVEIAVVWSYIWDGLFKNLPIFANFLFLKEHNFSNGLYVCQVPLSKITSHLNWTQAPVDLAQNLSEYSIKTQKSKRVRPKGSTSSHLTERSKTLNKIHIKNLKQNSYDNIHLRVLYIARNSFTNYNMLILQT